MDFSEVAVGSPVVARHADISCPNAGIGEVARAFGEGGAVRPLIYLHIHANSGDFQRPQVSSIVIEVAGHVRVADGAGGEVLITSRGISPRADGGIGGGITTGIGIGVGVAAHSVHQPSRHSAGGEVGRQILPGAAEIAGGRSKARSDQGGGLAPVHVLVLRLVDHILGGGVREQVIVCAVKAVFQGAGLGDTERSNQQGRDKQGFQMGFQLHVADLLSLIFS